MRWEARVAALAVLLSACTGLDATPDNATMMFGDADRGRALIRDYGCGTCHTIPGVRGANSLVGPPLTSMRHRTYVAGVIPNTPENLVRWIMDPQAVDSLTAMPMLGVTRRDAEDIARYLYAR